MWPTEFLRKLSLLITCTVLRLTFLHTRHRQKYIKTNSMGQSPFSGAGSHSSSQEILRLLPEGSLPCSQEPITGPYPEPDESSPRPPHPTAPRTMLILFSYLHVGLQTKIWNAYIISPVRVAFTAHLEPHTHDATAISHASFTPRLNHFWHKIFLNLSSGLTPRLSCACSHVQ
jgi:hypothetical protein